VWVVRPEEPLRKTDCCDNWVCDRDDEYVPNSFSRECCNRSHERYTACAFHHREKHEGKDWRDCLRCFTFLESKLQHCNGYNFIPPRIPRPKGEGFTDVCAVCGGRFLKDVETWVSKFDPTGHETQMCEACGKRAELEYSIETRASK
jgi:hypothetical protein